MIASRWGRIAVCAGVAVSMVAGCSRTERELKVVQSHETPFIQELEPRYSQASIGIEDHNPPPRVRFVTPAPPVEPTPEERKILGEPEDPRSYTALEFYQPTSESEKHIDRFGAGMSVGRTRASGVSGSYNFNPPAAGVGYELQVPVGVYRAKGQAAMAPLPPTETSGTYQPTGEIVGYERAKGVAGQERRRRYRP